MQAPNGYSSGTERIGSTLALLDGILRITGVISMASFCQNFVAWNNWITSAISWYRAVMYPAIAVLFSSLNLSDLSSDFEEIERSAEIPPEDEILNESIDALELEPLLEVRPNLDDDELLLIPTFDLTALALIVLFLIAVIMIQSEFGLRQIRYLGLSIIKSKVFDAVSWILIGFTVLLFVNVVFG